MAVKLDKIRKILKEKNLDALMVTNPANRRYLSGFDGTSGMLLIGAEEAFLLTDFRYLEQASVQAKDFDVQRLKDDYSTSLVSLLDQAGWRKIGFEAKHLVYALKKELEKKLPVKLVALEETAEEQRMIKTGKELAVLRQGAKVLDKAFSYICSKIKPGISELEIALELEIFLLRQGAEEKSFRFIVASGPRGAMPHGTASEKIVEEGELITIDFGAVFNGYATDITRTVALGKVNVQGRSIYDIVKEAHEEALNVLKPGLTGKEVDKVARTVIIDAGYGEYFGHGLGHGVGLETHEKPLLNSRSDTVLQEGMVVTIEPGIYLPDRCGVRIEDMVVITKESYALLTKCNRELVII